MKTILSLLTFLVFVFIDLQGQMLNYKNTDLPFEERAEILVKQMTLDEKISQMTDVAPAIPRLDVPAYNWWNEGLHGVARAGYATVFPQAIGLAAMWNDSLMFKIATVISDEFRAKYNDAIKSNDRSRYKGLTVWSPNINIFRDPRWGRGQETYGEDPYLTSSMGVSFVKGLQGNDPKYLKTVATPKHYVVHSGPEKSRHTYNANVGDRDFLETYTPAFEACIRDAKAYSIMSAYNQFRGQSCSGSDSLLNIKLRKQWGFQGYVVSDCDAVADIYNTHKISKTPEEAVAIAVKRGCDLDCGDFYKNLKSAVEKGLISEADIDISVKRLMLARMKLGMFDPPAMVPYSNISLAKNDCAENRAMSLQAARQSLVLLKNNGALPLNRRILNKIAILGPNSNNAAVMYGNYNGTPSKSVTPYEGLSKAVLAKTKILHDNLNPLVTGMSELTAIPAKYLESDGKPGLKAEFFNNIKFEGNSILVKNDTVLNYDWDGKSPFEGVSANNISIRWTGKIIIPETGDYFIGFTGDDGYKIWIDGKLIAEEWRDQGALLTQKSFKFIKGEKHDIKIEYYQSTGGALARLQWGVNDPKAADKIIEQASDCDVIIYVGGLSPMLEGEEMNVPYEGFEGGDRTKIDLPKVQTDMLKRLKKTGKPVILVLMTGSALAINWENENVDAILLSWYPGQEGGKAIAEAILGDYNPGGRLPVTFYKSTEQVPPFDNYDMKGRTYRYFSGEPLYPFGYGLSYSKFNYSNLVVPSESTTSKGFKVKVTIQNIGTRGGDEVVQLYVRHPTATVPVPIRSLKGFKRIFLKGGETRTVEFNLDLKSISILNAQNKRYVAPGDVDIFVGGQQPSEKLIKEGKVLMGTVTKTGDDYYIE